MHTSACMHAIAQMKRLPHASALITARDTCKEYLTPVPAVSGVRPDKLVEAHGSVSTASCIVCRREHSSQFVQVLTNHSLTGTLLASRTALLTEMTWLQCLIFSIWITGSSDGRWCSSLHCSSMQRECSSMPVYICAGHTFHMKCSCFCSSTRCVYR